MAELLSAVNRIAGAILGLAAISALITAADLLSRRNRSRWSAADLAWPAWSLLLGPLALGAYFRLGRGGTGRSSDEKPRDIGRVLGEWPVFLGSWAVAGLALRPELLPELAVPLLVAMLCLYLAAAVGPIQCERCGIELELGGSSGSTGAFMAGVLLSAAFVRLVLFRHGLGAEQPIYWVMLQLDAASGVAAFLVLARIERSRAPAALHSDPGVTALPPALPGPGRKIRAASRRGRPREA